MNLVRLAFKCTLLLLASTAAAQDAVDMHMSQAGKAIDAGQSKQAVEHLTKLLEAEPKYAVAYYLRGREHFRLGQVEQSAADFDRYVKLKPEVESRQWERGIADYYAGNFDKGAKQFALYQTYHNNDVENAVWRYLCMAAAAGHSAEGLAQARAELLPIENDRRVPMMQIYAMYRGSMTPAQVLDVAEATDVPATEQNARQFYAHLYVGLYYEAQAKPELAKKHILAAEQHKIGHYMWDVAHIHAERFRQAAP